MKRALLTLMLLGCGRTAGVPGPEVVEPPKVQQQPLLGCEGKAVVALEDRTLRRITPEGTVTTLFTFGAGLPADQVSVSRWSTAGDFIGAVAFLHVGTQSAWTYEYLLMRSDGTVLFESRQVEPHSPSIFLGADGSLAVSARTGWLVRADGSVTQLGALQPMSPRLPSGEVLVAQGRPWDAASKKGTWKDGVFTPLPVALGAYPTFEVVGARLLAVDGQRLLSLLDGASIALPAANLALVQHAAERFVLLSNEQVLVRVDLAQGTAQTVANAPKVEERYQTWSAGLQADGAVLAGTAKGEQLQLQRSGDLGQSWADVGEPMVLGDDLGLGRWMFATERAGSLLVHSMSTGYGHYVNEVQLVTAQGAHRVAAGGLWVNGDINPGATDLSADGQCAVAWVQEPGGSWLHGDPLELVFVAADGKRQVAPGLTSGGLRFVP